MIEFVMSNHISHIVDINDTSKYFFLKKDDIEKYRSYIILDHWLMEDISLTIRIKVFVWLFFINIYIYIYCTIFFNINKIHFYVKKKHLRTTIV